MAIPPPVRRRLLAVVALAVGAAAPGRAGADEGGSLRYDVRTDAVVTVPAAALLVGSELIVKATLPLGANWRSGNWLDSSVRNALVWHDTHAASITSYVTAGAAPVVALGLTALASAHDDGTLSEFPIDALLIAEATAVDGAVNQLVKFTVRRQRPCASSTSCPDSNSQPSKDDNLSFYSEHTSLIFAMAASAGTISRMRGHRWAPLVWIGTAVVGATTAYLRIAANEHHFTDVLTGAAMGTAIGAGVPSLFHRPGARGEEGGTLAVIPTVHGGAMTYALPF